MNSIGESRASARRTSPPAAPSSSSLTSGCTASSDGSRRLRNRVTLPAVPSRVLPFRHSATANGDVRPPVRVLIVDDEAEMRQYVERIMREAGYETALAADGEQAISLSGRVPAFDLMITDEMMPRIPRHQLARYMRERYLDIKVLYLTGFRDVLFKEKGSLWADEAFLEKPCTPEGLLQAVSLLLFGSITGRKPEQTS